MIFFSGSRSPGRSPSSFYPLHSAMWGFGSSSQQQGGSNGGGPGPQQPGSGAGTPVSLQPHKQDPVGGFGYPPTPPIDLKSSTDNHLNQHLQQSPVTHSPGTPVSHHHQDYLQPPPHSHHQDLVAHAAAVASSEAASVSALATLPSLSSIEAVHQAKSDHLMSTLGFPSYITAASTTAASASVNSRKFQEGNTTNPSAAQAIVSNGIMTSTGGSTSAGSSYNLSTAESAVVGSVASAASASAAYPYFTSPGADLYSGTSVSGYNSSSAVFSSKTLQPTRPRTKSRANAGKRDLYRKGGGSSLYIFQHFFYIFGQKHLYFFENQRS